MPLKAKEGAKVRALIIRTRVTLIALLAVAAAASATAASVSTAAAASGPVSIQATVTQGFSGIWQSSGAISDSGSFARTDVHLTGSFFNSPTVGVLQAAFAFSGSKGTFNVRDEVVEIGRAHV